MIRRGRYKYSHCGADPAQLYDVTADPMERDNLASSAGHADVPVAFAAEVTHCWDSDRIRDDVLATRRQRRAVHLAMQQGAPTSWDYQPTRDATQEFVCNQVEWTELAAKARFDR